MNEIIQTQPSAVMPVIDIAQANARRTAMVQFVKSIMVDGIDYGVIPGTGDKPTLLKPGAEKLTTFFGLSKRFKIVECVEDWTGESHNGEPFFYYLYRCQLSRGDVLIAEGDGSCNSWESKYRYRWVKEDEVPDNLDKNKLPKRIGAISEFEFAIEKAETGGKYGKPAEYWQRFKDAMESGKYRRFEKMTKSGKSYPAIEIGDTFYRVPNTDIASQVNTIQKMAQKRALVAATLLAVNASEFFTQDLEDIIDTPFVPATQNATKSTFVDAKPVRHANTSVATEDPDLAAIREASAENMADALTDFIIWFRERAKEERATVVSQGWQKSIRGKLSELANGDREQIIRFLSRITGREIKSSNDLNAGEWAALKAWLDIINVTGEDGKKMWIIGNKDAKFTFASHSK